MTPKRLLAFTVALWISILAVDHDRFREKANSIIQAEFCQASFKGDISAMKLWLAFGAKPNNMTLNWAASSRNPDALRLLLDHGADVNSTIKFGTTPLHSAAGSGYAENVRLLLQSGANINARDDIGTPLDCALENHQTEVVYILKQAGAKAEREIVFTEFTF